MGTNTTMVTMTHTEREWLCAKYSTAENHTIHFSKWRKNKFNFRKKKKS
jgi:hypothetical protein